MTSHYLNPVVPENFTNKGTTGDFSRQVRAGSYGERSPELRWCGTNCRGFSFLTSCCSRMRGRCRMGITSRSLGAMSYQHIFSPAVLGNVVGMVRDNANNLYSNENSTPIIAFQHNYFREGYFKGTVSAHQPEPGVEVRGGIGYYVSSREVQLHDYRS